MSALNKARIGASRIKVDSKRNKVGFEKVIGKKVILKTLISQKIGILSVSFDAI